MEDITSTFKSEAKNRILSLQDDLKGIRTGRANPGMVEGIMISTYGGSTNLKLRDLASIMTEGATALVIVPFDPSTVKDIEKAILASPLGINPQTEGTKMYLRIPPLSEEQRMKYIKLVGTQIEETKNLIRRDRDNARKKIKSAFDAKSIPEDQKFREEKDIDTATTELMNELTSLREKKEKEIMEV
jgi:ribosome recycling factor